MLMQERTHLEILQLAKFPSRQIDEIKAVTLLRSVIQPQWMALLCGKSRQMPYQSHNTKRASLTDLSRLPLSSVFLGLTILLGVFEVLILCRKPLFMLLDLIPQRRNRTDRRR
jgi:hypothetical protein